MSTLPDTSQCIDVCNDLLRGELSAVETYSEAINTYSREPEVMILKTIREDHVDSANRLRRNVKSMGGEPELSSGARGDFTKAVQVTANFFGEGSAIASLKQGEEVGKSMYEKALANETVLEHCKELVRSSLLPRVSSHILNLESLQKRAKAS